MDDYLVVNSARFPHETIDNETIIFDAVTGHIVLLSGFAAVVWMHFLKGERVRDFTAVVETRFGAGAVADIELFVDELLKSEMLVPSSKDDATGTAALPWPEVFQRPVLERFDDIAKIISMDPIHDVDETGWPRPAKP